MSKIIIIAVFIFWAGISFFYANSLVKQNVFGTSSNIPASSSVSLDNTQTNTLVAPSSTAYTLTAAIVAEHNIASDCWVTGNGNVFNVTSYINAHPGGKNNIIAYCGKDIQAAFNSQGHSAKASNIFASYKIGTLGASVSVDPVNNTPPPPVNNGRGDDDDDEWDDD